MRDISSGYSLVGKLHHASKQWKDFPDHYQGIRKFLSG